MEAKSASHTSSVLEAATAAGMAAEEVAKFLEGDELSAEPLLLP